MSFKYQVPKRFYVLVTGKMPSITLLPVGCYFWLMATKRPNLYPYTFYRDYLPQKLLGTATCLLQMEAASKTQTRFQQLRSPKRSNKGLMMFSKRLFLTAQMTPFRQKPISSTHGYSQLPSKNDKTCLFPPEPANQPLLPPGYAKNRDSTGKLQAVFTRNLTQKMWFPFFLRGNAWIPLLNPGTVKKIFKKNIGPF